jgi:hypothetical protein
MNNNLFDLHNNQADSTVDVKEQTTSSEHNRMEFNNFDHRAAHSHSFVQKMIKGSKIMFVVAIFQAIQKRSLLLNVIK